MYRPYRNNKLSIVKTEEDFNDLIVYLKSNEEKDSRKLDYLKYFGTQTKNNLFSLRKVQFLNEISGNFISRICHELGDITSTTEEMEQSEIHSPQLPLLKERQAQYVSILYNFQNALNQEVFEGVMQERNMSVEDSTNMFLEFEKTNNLVHSLATTLLEKKNDGAKLALINYFKSPQSRIDLKSREELNFKNSTPINNLEQLRFKVILKYIQETAMPKVRSEMMAKFYFYIESGWALGDIYEKSTHNTSKSATKLSNLIDNILTHKINKEKIDKDLMLNAIKDRFNELFLNVEVIESKNGNDNTIKSIKKNTNFDFLASSGAIDLVIQNYKNPETLHVGFCTSREILNSNMQFFRHSEAIEKLKKSTVCRSFKDCVIGNIKNIEYNIFMPCSIYSNLEKQKKGRMLFSSIASHFTKKIIPEKYVEAINTLPLLLETIDASNSHHKTSNIVNMKLIQFGYKNNYWENQRYVLSKQNDSKKEIMLAQNMQNIGIEILQMLTPNKTNNSFNLKIPTDLGNFRHNNLSFYISSSLKLINNSFETISNNKHLLNKKEKEEIIKKMNNVFSSLKVIKNSYVSAWGSEIETQKKLFLLNYSQSDTLLSDIKDKKFNL